MNFKYIKYIDNKFFKGIVYKFYKKYFLLKKIRKAQRERILNINKLDKFKFSTYWNNHFSHIIKNSLKGDIVECGVGDGFHLSFLLFNMKNHKELNSKKYYGFDSFEGFPEPSTQDISKRKAKKGDWGHTDQDYVKNNLKKIGFEEKDFQNIRFVKGYFDKSFTENNELVNEICLLHLDCDLYKSYKDSLNFFYSKVVENGIVAFDEYKGSENTFPGAIKAIDEFFGENKKNIQKCNISGKYYIIKK